MFWETALLGLPLIADHFSDERNRRDADTYNRMSREDQTRQENLQREFAQNGVQWRVEDAARAGIHPLYALGSNGATYSPTSLTFAQPQVRSNYGDYIARMGQNVSRAIHATSSQAQRESQMFALQMEGAQLENEFKRIQLNNLKQVGPAFPSSSGLNYLDGQGNSNPTMVQEIPLRTTISEPGNRAQDIGSIPDYALTRTPTGMAVVPSKDVKERIEDQLIPEIMWAIRNNLMPMFTGHTPPNPRHHRLPYGFNEWRWKASRQEFRPYYNRNRYIKTNYTKG